MNSQEILERLRGSERVLRERGVVHAALFGSAARGDERSDSDIDIMVAIDPDARIGLFAHGGIVRFIEPLFPVRVEVADREGLKSSVRPSEERAVAYAF